MAAKQAAGIPTGLRGWLEHIRACEAKGQRLFEYAREHGLDQKGFYNAKARLIKRGVLKSKYRAVAFQRVEVRSAGRPMACRVYLPNGVVVEMGAEGSRLSEVLQMARAL